MLLITCSYRGQEFIRIGYYVDTYVEGKLDEHLQRRRKEEEMADAEEIGDDGAMGAWALPCVLYAH